jgi:hypothetical protein
MKSITNAFISSGLKRMELIRQTPFKDNLGKIVNALKTDSASVI